jgi:hypothetical protein
MPCSAAARAAQQTESIGRRRRLSRILSLFEVPQSGIEETPFCIVKPAPPCHGWQGGAGDRCRGRPVHSIGEGGGIKEEQEPGRDPLSFPSTEAPSSFRFVESLICPPPAPASHCAPHSVCPLFFSSPLTDRRLPSGISQPMRACHSSLRQVTASHVPHVACFKRPAARPRL